MGNVKYYAWYLLLGFRQWLRLDEQMDKMHLLTALEAERARIDSLLEQSEIEKWKYPTHREIGL
jgi:hypothetical protein